MNINNFNATRNMSEQPTTYWPDGTGHCRHCHHDVRAHEGGHEFVERELVSPFHGIPVCDYCLEIEGHPIHDVGRVLRCPKVER